MEDKIDKNIESFKAITDKMLNIYERKNHDYGNSFDKSLDKRGLVASAVRMEDKFNRFDVLMTKQAQVADESIRDTLIDLANYAILTVMWMDSHK